MDFVFDLDGTLTPAGGEMNPEFHDWFIWFVRSRRLMGQRVYLLSGNSHSNSVNKLGTDLIAEFSAVFCDLGNTRWRNALCVHRYDHHWPAGLSEYLTGLAAHSPYSVKGKPVTVTGGVVRFSVPGVDNQSFLEKQRYWYYDRASSEREIFVKLIQQTFSDLSAVISGFTTVDIVGKDKTKIQISDVLRNPCCYFGNEIKPMHNDYDIAMHIHSKHSDNEIYPVLCWQETWEILRWMVRHG